MNNHKLPYTIDHIGIAVKSIDSSVKTYINAFNAILENRETLTDNGVEVAFISCGNTRIEFLEPLPNNKTVKKFLEKRGEGLHHICYKVEDINSALEDLKKQGYSLIDEKPRSGAHNHLIAFLKPKDFMGVLVELCEHTG